MECGCEAAAFFFACLKAAASQPHSMGFAVNNALLSILHRPVKPALINIGIRDNAAETAALHNAGTSRKIFKIVHDFG
jgi:hypothetical protein